MNLPIPTTDTPVEFTPPTLLEQHNLEAKSAAPKSIGPAPIFLVKPASEIDYEKLGFELFRHNIAPPTQDTFRAAMIDEIFNIYGDADGEEKAALLDSYWSAEDVYNGEIEAWQVQDRQRRFDEANGAPKRAPEPLPTRTMGLRDRNKATLLAEEMRRASPRLRNLVVEMSSFGPKQSAGIARLTIDGWSGVETPFAKENGIVPEATWNALRTEIGKAAIAELVDFASGLGGLSSEDVGNSGSPLEIEATEQPSPEPSGGPEPSDGDSTSEETRTLSTSSSTLAPASESDPGTDEPSNSSSRSTGTTASEGDTQAEPSPAPPGG
jgi:hypothetical protein